MTLNKYLVDRKSVGDYQGQEQRAADNLNRIYHALDCRLNPILIVGHEMTYDPAKYDEIMCNVRKDWANRKEELLTLSDEQIQVYIDELYARYNLAEADRANSELQERLIHHGREGAATWPHQ